MKGEPIADDERIVRYCKHSTLYDGQYPSAASFMLRPNEPYEPYLSFFLLDRFAGESDEDRIEEIRSRAHPAVMEFTRSAKLATLGVGEMRAHINNLATDHRWVRVLHEPIDAPIPFEQHAGVYDTASDEAMIAELIVEKVQKIYPALSG